MTGEAEQDRTDEDLPRMSFGDHLEELRRRLFISLAALLVCVIGMLPFKNQVTRIYTGPYTSMWLEYYADWSAALLEEPGAKGEFDDLEEKVRRLRVRKYDFHRDYREMILDGTFPDTEFADIENFGGFALPRTLKALGGLDDFWTFMAASLLFSLMIAAPVVLYQAWAFVAAGLYKKERKVVMRYVPFALLLFASGVSFGYFLVVPTGLYFLVRLMDWAQVTSMMSVSIYFSFLFTLTSALGLVFQLPLVMLALQKVGLVTHKAWRTNWRYVILGFFVVSAVFTPPDPFTQVMMAIPMVFLYLIGLVLTGRHSKSDPAEATAAAQ